MFHTSTQKSNWLFKDPQELAEIRKQANVKFIRKQNVDKNFLTYEEERIILLHYEYILKNFLGHFEPPITMSSVVGTSIIYFKRFYLRNSVMEYHPKDIYLVCVYLACKIEEFNISIAQFLSNVHTDASAAAEDKAELANMILSYELLLMEKLDFELTVYNFYRPFEGFMLDVRTRCLEIANVEVLRQFGMDFLDKILNTDVTLLYPPAQIAITAMVYSASKNKIDLDRYCQYTLLADLSREEIQQFLKIVKVINKHHKEIPMLNQEEIKRISGKLMECYCVENDPRSESFKQRAIRLMQEED
jgi:cyclin H